MKKTILTALIVFVTMVLSACQLFTSSVETTDTTTISSTTTSTTTTTSWTSQSTTTTTISTTAPTTATSASSSITIATEPYISTLTTTSNLSEPFVPVGYPLLQDELDVIGIPAEGNQKVLVFAVDFSDYPAGASGITLAEINLAFNGTSSEMAYESVNSYYLQSSYGNLNLSADIYGFYRAGHPSTYYADEYDKLYAWDYYTNDYLYSEDEVTYPDSDLIKELLTYYDASIDYSQYDSNEDGYIDGIYVIYTTPTSYDYGSDLWWAYQDTYMWEGDVYDGVEPYYFVWSGKDFFFENDEPLNARTIIHETGHMLGLDDYYDYDPEGRYNSGGLGLADMMDNTVGDHNPFSKLLLGWVEPEVATNSMTVTLSPFETSGDVVLIRNTWTDSIFTEYLLVSYYTPDHLNDDDPTSLFTVPGIIIYHISAAIGNGYDENLAYYTIFNNNNSDTYRKLIKIIEADMNGGIDKYGYSENSDLFQPGDILNGDVYPGYKWYNGIALGFTVEIVSVTPEAATIRIIFQ